MKSSGPGPKRHFAWMAESRARGAKTFALKLFTYSSGWVSRHKPHLLSVRNTGSFTGTKWTELSFFSWHCAPSELLFSAESVTNRSVSLLTFIWIASRSVSSVFDYSLRETAFWGSSIYPKCLNIFRKKKRDPQKQYKYRTKVHVVLQCFAVHSSNWTL